MRKCSLKILIFNITTTQMVADNFTKALPRDKHLYCMTHLRMCLILTTTQHLTIQALLVTTPYFSGSLCCLEYSLSGSCSLYSKMYVGFVSKTSQDLQELCIMIQKYSVCRIQTDRNAMTVELTFNFIKTTFFSFVLL